MTGAVTDAPTPKDQDGPAIDELYRSLAEACTARPTVIAQIGQSLDGRIATQSGHSHYIGCPESLDHLHRLRALADAVVVGASTAALDNPRLTTRRVPGTSPVRAVIDPNRRVPGSHTLFTEADAETLLFTRQDADDLPSHCTVLPLPDDDAEVPATVLAALRSRGLKTILIEGGGKTISAFMEAGLVDRLHVAVAPLIIGSGRPGLSLPEIEKLDAALRFETRTYRLGADTLFECCFSSETRPQSDHGARP